MTGLTITNEYGYVPCVENHNPVLSLFMTYNCKKTNMTGATSGAGIAYHSAAPGLISSFCWARVVQFSVFLCSVL
jgi:hypothetical protein